MDFSGINGTINELAKQLALFSIIVILIGLVIAILLKVLKVPKIIAESILGLAVIYVAYKVFMWIIA